MHFRPWIPLLLATLLGAPQAATLSYLTLGTRAQVGSELDTDGAEQRFGPGLLGEVRANSSVQSDPAQGSVFARAGGFVRLPGTGRVDLLINTFNDATALGGGLMRISGQITGQTGATGVLRFFGDFGFGVSHIGPGDPALDGLNVGLADVGQLSTLVLTGAGQSACPSSGCRASDQLRYRFEGRSGPTGAGLSVGRGYQLELPVTVGDSFSFFFQFVADLGYGYSAIMGDIGSLAPAPALRSRALVADAASLASVFQPGIGGAFLSDGLGLSADSGLVFGNGIWSLPGAANPDPDPPTGVPAPGTPVLLALGLGLLALRRRCRA